MDQRDLCPAECPRSPALEWCPYWTYTIAPAIRSGKRVLIAAHGSSLRALIKHVDKLSAPDIASVKVPAGIPLVYHLEDDLTAIRHFYLAHPENVRETSRSVA